ncbi:hypothetical protein NDU88_001063 [Pleurodeles waltl]|uniref:Uncharacterized protein n=1 Tax=Pleurodeles waltl TaxID=8319 RepID=A0AAV7LC18_PLEWA|nr:hypothetical protein NDU88_001063 [Pleurodeles waltl]
MEPAEWIFSVCYADTENLGGALLGGPCRAHAIGMGTAGAPRGPTTPVNANQVLAVKTARTRLAVRGSESTWRRCLQRRHGGFLRPGENRRETAGFPFQTAALPPRSELAWMHRQPVGGASAVSDNDPHSDYVATAVFSAVHYVTTYSLSL